MRSRGNGRRGLSCVAALAGILLVLPLLPSASAVNLEQPVRVTYEITWKNPALSSQAIIVEAKPDPIMHTMSFEWHNFLVDHAIVVVATSPVAAGHLIQADGLSAESLLWWIGDHAPVAGDQRAFSGIGQTTFQGIQGGLWVFAAGTTILGFDPAQGGLLTSMHASNVQNGQFEISASKVENFSVDASNRWSGILTFLALAAPAIVAGRLVAQRRFGEQPIAHPTSYCTACGHALVSRGPCPACLAKGVTT